MQQQDLLQGARSIYEDDHALEILDQYGVYFEHQWEEVYSASSDNKSDTRHTFYWQFPRPLPFGASFSQEGLLDKIGKLFSKEPQVGDPIFDDNVFIKASAEAPCLLMLTDRCQGAILTFVQQGGEVIINQNQLIITFFESQSFNGNHEMEEQIIIAAHLVQFIA